VAITAPACYSSVMLSVWVIVIDLYGYRGVKTVYISVSYASGTILSIVGWVLGYDLSRSWVWRGGGVVVAVAELRRG
jgi:hypothetical protein